MQITIPQDYRGLRLDQALAKCFPEHSRTRLSDWIKQGLVSIDGEICEPKAKVIGGEQVNLQPQPAPQFEDIAQELPLTIVYEDEAILVINKPAGLVVHPGAGNRQGTLLNGLLHHSPNLNLIPRAGIVHRLDKDTTGLMVIAKTLEAHTALVAALQKREVQREYLALVGSEIIAGSTIEAPIGRHTHQRTKMAVSNSGKPACTHFRCKKRYHGFTLLHVKLETGRTHQIRVHLSHIGHPIVGDSMYGWRSKVPPKSSPELIEGITGFKRQALHAFALSLHHPVSGQLMQWKAPLPEDFSSLLKLLIPKEGYIC